MLRGADTAVTADDDLNAVLRSKVAAGATRERPRLLFSFVTLSGAPLARGAPESVTNVAWRTPTKGGLHDMDRRNFAR